MLKAKIKYIITMAISYLLHILWIFPLKKNSIIFMSFDGEQFSDNPLTICESIKKEYPEKELIWVLEDISKADERADKVVNRHSFEFYREITSCGTIISNNAIASYIPVRKKQIFINTWHGCCPTKKLGLDEKVVGPFVKYHLKIQDSKTTAMVSGAKFFDDVIMAKSFNFKKVQPLDFGCPRNDALFQSHPELVEKVYQYFNLDPSISIILYAPTFRGSHKNGAFIPEEDLLNVDEVVKAFEKRFNKKFVFLFRAHHAMDPNCMPGCINATNYPNMMDLLYAIDYLITDYSSCMCDLALMRKPSFVYAPDYEQYMEERGMYYTLDQFPFDYGLTKEAFIQCIENYDEERFQKRLDQYLAGLGNFEDGHATERVLNWLKEKWSQQ